MLKRGDLVLNNGNKSWVTHVILLIKHVEDDIWWGVDLGELKDDHQYRANLVERFRIRQEYVIKIFSDQLSNGKRKYYEDLIEKYIKKDII